MTPGATGGAKPNVKLHHHYTKIFIKQLGRENQAAEPRVQRKQGTIGHAAKSHKGRLQRPSHTHAAQGPDKANDGSPHPGALHHAIIIQVNNYHCVYVAVAQRFASLHYPFILATNLTPIHPNRKLTTTIVGSLLATAERTCEGSHCPLRDLYGSSGRRGTTNPKHYSKFRPIDPAGSPWAPSSTFLQHTQS